MESIECEKGTSQRTLTNCGRSSVHRWCGTTIYSQKQTWGQSWWLVYYTRTAVYSWTKESVNLSHDINLKWPDSR